MDERILEATAYLNQCIPAAPAIGTITGSGLGAIVEKMTDLIRIDYADIPHFPVSTVPGHAGEVIVGRLAGRRLFVLSGRVHYYEGHGIDAVVFPTKVMAALGIKAMVVTNAAGAINKGFYPGDVVAITNHVDLMRDIALVFPEPRDVYDPMLRERLRLAAEEQGIALKQGVYAAVSGPSYETPAEIKALQVIGADMVGMSTVPEAKEASKMGMKVLGISFITNPAAGLGQNPLSHQEVMETSAHHLPTLKRLIETFFAKLDPAAL
ncbi:MAG: purine-nucleoside phosphorylase [Thermodesulfobacteriota bacterium]